MSPVQDSSLQSVFQGPLITWPHRSAMWALPHEHTLNSLFHILQDVCW